jgi:hypothetical protein
MVKVFTITGIHKRLFLKNDQERGFMGQRKVYLAVVTAFVGLFLYFHETACASNAYFSPAEIKKHLLAAIEESRESIDIAIVNIHSKDILNALSRAQERGVNIRLVTSKKQISTKRPLPNFLSGKKFAARIYPHKGLMHNNFAIFDCKLLATGSYYWVDRVNKPHCDNILFTNETHALVKYQKEFDRLFQEAAAPDTGEAAYSSVQKTGKKDTETEAAALTATDQGKQVIAANFGVVIKEAPDGYIDMDFEQFDEIFGVAGDLTEEQKDALWNRCTGKKVRWKGRVKYIGWTLMTGWLMSVTQGDTHVEVKLDAEKKSHFSHVKFGNTVTYTGKLDTRVTKIFPYSLNAGDVIETVETRPEQPKNNDSMLHPYIMPVSQGPKKIFIIESFEDLENIFGKNSKLSDAQKEEAWKKYEGKYVNWEGQIAYKSVSDPSDFRVGIKHPTGKMNIEVKFSPAKKNKISKFQEGETVLYSGKLTTRLMDNTPLALEDGDIVTWK